MIELQRKENCCGCTACANACPIYCIEMHEDEEGFQYPHIDKGRCLNCHKCEKVCPVLDKSVQVGKPQAYLARTKDADLLQKCTSGGVFTEIARDVVGHGGIAYGAVYDEAFIVRHRRIDDLSDMEKLPGSKYVQSDLGGVFSQLKKDVADGKEVVFCGTPCQVAGLKSFLGKDHDNLLLIDLVCHGVPSPKLWMAYVAYLESKHGKLAYANFRSKRLGYHVSVMEEQFISGRSQIGSARTNLMSKCFFQNAADRPICYECPFKTVSRCSDLTLFDGWHASDHVPGLKDDDKGYTIILSQSEKGQRFLDSSQSLGLHGIDTDRAIELDGKMALASVQRPANRDEFYALLEQRGIDGTVQVLFPISKIDYMIEKSKLILDRAGILQKVKQMKG